MSVKISLVAAVAMNNAIGKDNQLLWHLPDDFKFFKNYTTGKVIVMGRKTFESIGSRPLPNRTNVVISRGTPALPQGVVLAESLQKALSGFSEQQEICIIGGAQIYNQALPLATHLVLTRVHCSPQADVFFPAFDEDEFELEWEEFHPRDEKHLYEFSFQIWRRKGINP